MSMEKESPSITYEAFVEDLDEGDAFTASLFDILVKVGTSRLHRQCVSHVANVGTGGASNAA